LGLQNDELSVLLCRDLEITKLNRKYFGKNRPTNVISFPMDRGQPGEGPDGPGLLGDVAISSETAAREARDAGLCMRERTAQLLIHGILHLVGYDHIGEAAERRRMERKEKAIYSGLKIAGKAEKYQ